LTTLTENDDDEGVEPIPLDALLGGGGRTDDDDYDGTVIIDTDWEQRGGDPPADKKRG
jgi:hypothetical protein